MVAMLVDLKTAFDLTGQGSVKEEIGGKECK